MIPDISLGDEVFRGTLIELERGLNAALITTRNLQSLDSDCPVEVAEWQMKQRDISQMPVKKEGKTIGVYLQQGRVGNEPVEAHLQHMDDSLLVAMNASLLDLIHSLATEAPDYRLVVGQHGIEGIVTKSDLQKLPVRLLAYSLVTHLESVMANLIQRRCPDENTWLSHLARGCVELFPNWDSKNAEEWRVELRGRQNGMRKGGIVPDLLDLTDFRHKYVILWMILPLSQEFVEDMRLINKWLRNTVAHSRSLPPTTQHLLRFSEDLHATREWTKTLSDMLGPAVEPERALDQA